VWGGPIEDGEKAMRTRVQNGDGRMRATRVRSEVETLQAQCVETIVRNMDRFTSLGGLPLSVCFEIVQRLLSLGLLTPHALGLLMETHGEIVALFKDLKADSTLPPVLPTRCRER